MCKPLNYNRIEENQYKWKGKKTGIPRIVDSAIRGYGMKRAHTV